MHININLKIQKFKQRYLNGQQSIECLIYCHLIKFFLISLHLVGSLLLNVLPNNPSSSGPVSIITIPGPSTIINSFFPNPFCQHSIILTVCENPITDVFNTIILSSSPRLFSIILSLKILKISEFKYLPIDYIKTSSLDYFESSLNYVESGFMLL